MIRSRGEFQLRMGLTHSNSNRGLARLHLVCQEELFNHGLGVSINLN